MNVEVATEQGLCANCGHGAVCHTNVHDAKDRRCQRLALSNYMHVWVRCECPVFATAADPFPCGHPREPGWEQHLRCLKCPPDGMGYGIVRMPVADFLDHRFPRSLDLVDVRITREYGSSHHESDAFVVAEPPLRPFNRVVELKFRHTLLPRCPPGTPIMWFTPAEFREQISGCCRQFGLADPWERDGL